MARRLIAYVHVDGVAYGPDSKVPADVAKRIGDHAWTDADSSAEAPTPTGEGDGSKGEAPPRSGRGSGREAWVTFAEAQGLDVDEDRTREQIIADLEERGVIEPEQRKE
ncbi:hypothetical protein [Streptomyces mirabilis]|uniref:hypothetical protein n=1 Tax=Streptomyces mirabilis TaxID=68239 RepID=UPI00225923CD|nr:hypothetical protein [Streptomyces mirabilis]MCX4606987.1 hypothetical protein [Streptomyces mirabilis]